MAARFVAEIAADKGNCRPIFVGFHSRPDAHPFVRGACGSGSARKNCLFQHAPSLQLGPIRWVRHAVTESFGERVSFRSLLTFLMSTKRPADRSNCGGTLPQRDRNPEHTMQRENVTT